MSNLTISNDSEGLDCPRCGKGWVELTRDPCPRCHMPFDTWADGTRQMSGSDATALDEPDIMVCGRCTDHESLLRMRNVPLPTPDDWPLHPNRILRDSAPAFGDRDWVRLTGQRMYRERAAQQQ